jgi:hypothetical protein
MQILETPCVPRKAQEHGHSPKTITLNLVRTTFFFVLALYGTVRAGDGGMSQREWSPAGSGGSRPRIDRRGPSWKPPKSDNATKRGETVEMGFGP